MSSRPNNSVKEVLVGALIITGVVVYLLVFHFVLGMTWMIYVLVIVVGVLMLLRKWAAKKKRNTRLTKGSS